MNLSSHLNCIQNLTQANIEADNITFNYEDFQYFLITTNIKKCFIKVIYINKRENISTTFIDFTAKQLSNQILNKYSLNSFHAAYLGRELMKAELTLVFKQKYIQN